MAFVVRRPGGRWEIRQSFLSDEGPRARTLASFKTLSSETVDKALRRAQGRVKADDIVRAARRAGAPFEPAPADALAEQLVRRLAQGERVRPGLRRLLLDRLDDAASPTDESFSEWLGASAEERAQALVELLDLVDRLPHRRGGELRFPRLSSSRTGA